MVVVLPAHPSTGGDDTRGQLAVLSEADIDGRLLAARSLRGATAREPVYVHAKIGIVDDRWLTLGSANLNEHSLFNDTEVNLVVDDPALAATRDTDCGPSTWSSPSTRSPVILPTLVDDVWRPIASEQLPGFGPAPLPRTGSSCSPASRAALADCSARSRASSSTASRTTLYAGPSDGLLPLRSQSAS